MRITIPDDVLAPYEEMAQRQGRPVDDVVAAQLKRFAMLEPGKKAVVIPPAALTALEPPLGGTPVRDAQDLLTRIQQLANISFMGLNLGLSLQQKAELAHRAERQGRTVEALVQEMWRDLQQNFFWSGGGGEAAPVPPPNAPRRPAQVA